MVRTSYIRRDDDDVCYVQDQHAFVGSFQC